MPWDGLQRDASKEVKKEIYALAKDELALTITKDEREFGFRFNINNYFVLAVIMIKYDRNLGDVRERLVPTEIDEDEFWFNYFYQIECIKHKLGLPNMLVPLDQMNAQINYHHENQRVEERKEPIEVEIEKDQAVQEVELQEISPKTDEI
mmetsp:Transcript_19152/g.26567  ORF Transcript_19152/g.26567 Transcript_19152/m.26567 type:complete len:150 (-) Transcript_19152:88-537(-)